VLEGDKAQEVPVEAELQTAIKQELNSSVKQENPKSPEKAPNGLDKPQQPSQDPQKEIITNPLEPAKGLQIPSPPASSNETSQNSRPIGLGINTNPEPTTTSASGTAGPPDSSIDSLFDIPDDANGDLNFDNMDFSYSSNTNQDQSQPQNNELDLSTFGNDSQYFTMSNIPPSNDENTGNNTNNPSQNKPAEDIFSGLDTTGTGDTMDLDLEFETLGAEESAFDDMLFGDDGGGEMAHGEFDSAFFGLDGST
jgi:hypothetical protein